MRLTYLSLLAASMCSIAHASAPHHAPSVVSAGSSLPLKISLFLSSPPVQDESVQPAPSPTGLSSFSSLNLSPFAIPASALLAQADDVPSETSANTSTNTSTKTKANGLSGLHALLARVVVRDAQVQSAQAALASAQARYRQARSRMLPNLGVQANHGRSNDLDGRLTVERKTQQVEASLRWNLYQGGTDYAELAASEAEIIAAEAELQRANEEVAVRLSEAYSDLLRLRHSQRSAAARLAEVRQLVAQVALQTEAGKLSELDLQQAQNAELEAELSHSTLDSEQQSALIRLRLLAQGAWSDDLVEFNLAHSTAKDTTRNAALRVAQARASAAQLRVRSLTATLAPKVDLSVRHLLNNHTTPPPSTLQQRGWSVGVSWDIPLGGENFAKRDETISRAKQAQAEVERAELAARTEFESLAPLIANLQRSILNLSAQDSKMTQLMRASGIQFEAGRRSLQQIIQSQDSYFNLQQRQHEQQHRLRVTQLRQLVLTGQLLESLGLRLGT